MKKLTFSLLLVFVLTLLPLNGQVQAGTIPTISIQGVTQNEKVTIATYNFPAHYNFVVRMGLFGTTGVGGIQVGTIDSGTGGSLKFTFPIPADLYAESMIAIRLESTTGGFYAYNWFYNTTAGTHSGGVPTGEVVSNPIITATSVKAGEYVVMKGIDFPANEDFNILMGEYGSQGIGGVLADTVNSGADGDFVKTVTIPASLASETVLAIRFESQDSDLTLHTWFNNQSGANGGSGGPTGVYYGIPTISILSVDEDNDVTIQAYNFPADQDFTVLMGKMWTQGIGGIAVTTLNSGQGGSFTATFDIPAALKSDAQIAIRLQTVNGYFYAYNWFYNNTTTSSGTALGVVTGGYTGVPTFSITAVVKDDQVTIQTANFPAGYDFNVLMGKMWTQGIGGIPVTTIASGDGGSFTKTFTIPAALAGEGQIAIRLEATSGGFYAYNWFYNNSTP